MVYWFFKSLWSDVFGWSGSERDREYGGIVKRGDVKGWDFTAEMGTIWLSLSNKLQRFKPIVCHNYIFQVNPGSYFSCPWDDKIFFCIYQENSHKTVLCFDKLKPREGLKKRVVCLVLYEFINERIRILGKSALSSSETEVVAKPFSQSKFRRPTNQNWT